MKIRLFLICFFCFQCSDYIDSSYIDYDSIYLDGGSWIQIDNRGDLAFVFRNRSQAEPYSEKIDPREAERLSDFIKEGGFEYMSDVKPREIIDSIRSDVNTKKYVKTPEGWR